MKFINTEEDAREKLLKGIDVVTDIVKSTLGPCGSNVILKKAYNVPTIVNDGVSIAKEVVLEDATENAGATLLTSAASNTNAAVGDGTTTTCILTQSIIKQGFKAIEEQKANPILLREALKKVTEEVVYPELNTFSQDCNEIEELKHVATISVGGNKEVGDVVAKALEAVGTEGIVALENNAFPEIKLDIINGYKIDRGYMTPYAINDTEKFRVDYSNCLVVCCYQRIVEPVDVEALFKWAHEAQKPILLIVNEMDENIFAALQMNLMRKSFKIVPVKSPGFGFNVRDYMNDIAKLTGCVVFAEDTKKLREFQPQDFGVAGRVMANRETTSIIPVEGFESEELDEYVNALKNQLEATENEHMRDSLKTRISKLTCGVATISVGATTEAEQLELKLRVEDAINATRSALKGGTVPGGGNALLCLSMHLDAALDVASYSEKKVSQEEIVALEILREAFKEPFRILAINSGADPSKFEERQYLNHGFNARTRQYSNLREDGIIDPTLVVKATIENSVAIASIILTTQATIIAEDKGD